MTPIARTEDMNHSPWVVKRDDAWRRIAAQIGCIKTYGANAIVYAQGESSDYFQYLQKGRVKVSILRPDGSERTLAIHEPGSIFGETSCVDGRPYFATAVTLAPSEIASIPFSAFLSLAGEQPAAIHSMFESLSRKLRLLAFHVESASFSDASGRIAHVLDELCSDFGSQAHEGIYIRLKLTHKEIGDLSGTSRVTTTKVLADLRDRGIVEILHRHIVILDRIRLKQVALGLA